MRTAPCVAGLALLSALALAACSSSGGSSGTGGSGPGAGETAAPAAATSAVAAARARGPAAAASQGPAARQPASPAPPAPAGGTADRHRRHLRPLRPHPLRHHAPPLRKLRVRQPRRHPLANHPNRRRDHRRRRHPRRARHARPPHQDDHRRRVELRLHQRDEDVSGDEQRPLRAHVRLVRGRADDGRALLARRGGRHRARRGSSGSAGSSRRSASAPTAAAPGDWTDSDRTKLVPTQTWICVEFQFDGPNAHLPRLVGRHGAADAHQRAQQARELHHADLQRALVRVVDVQPRRAAGDSGSTRSPSTTSRSAARSSAADHLVTIAMSMKNAAVMTSAVRFMLGGSITPITAVSLPSANSMSFLPSTRTPVCPLAINS